ncbi:MAG: hypothetical protein H9W81_07530 [Enterococcus sp.]|nr:hypothetical protein [Enterococcus sp.]
MSVKFYFAVTGRADNNIQYEVDISREEFAAKLPVNGKAQPWDYFIMKNEGLPLIVTNEYSPAGNNLSYFEDLLGAPIKKVDKEHPAVTKLCINILPTEVTDSNYLKNNNPFSHNYVLHRDPYKVLNMLSAMAEISGNKFQTFVAPFSGNPEITILVEAGSPLAPLGIGFWNDIFMGELTD